MNGNVRRDSAGFVLACAFVAVTVVHAAFCLYLHQRYGLATLLLGAFVSQQSMAIAFLFCWRYVDNNFKNPAIDDELEEEPFAPGNFLTPDAIYMSLLEEEANRNPDPVATSSGRTSRFERGEATNPAHRKFTLLSFNSHRPYDHSALP